MPTRIGFLVPHPEWFHHFDPIVEALGPQNAVIAAHGTDAEIAETRRMARSRGLDFSIAEERIESGQRFHVMVSGHPVRMEPLPLPRQLADVNVRLMYSLGKARWNFSDWNEIYDVILCFGPYQAERLAKFSNPIVVQVGYPRYSNYLKSPPDAAALRASLGCDPAKKTVVWLPTWKNLSSIGPFSGAVARLAGEYNVIVKPHPLGLSVEPERTAHLAAPPFTRVVTELLDNASLYGVADYVICDYGGPAFGAIYLDRNIVLLDVPRPEDDELMGPDSPEAELRLSIVSVDLDRAASLGAILKDDRLWQDQRAVRDELRRRFFAPFGQNSAGVAAGVLRNLERICSEAARVPASSSRLVRKIHAWWSGSPVSRG